MPNFFAKIEIFLFKPKTLNYLFLIGLLVVSIGVRLTAINHESIDYQVFVSKWFDYIKDNGRFLSMK